MLRRRTIETEVAWQSVGLLGNPKRGACRLAVWTDFQEQDRSEIAKLRTACEAGHAFGFLEFGVP